MENKFTNVYQMLEHRVAVHTRQPAYYERANEKWVTTTWEQFKILCDQFAMALLAEGLEKGDTVSILSANRLIWPLADVGTIAAGGIAIGLYPTSACEQCLYILNHSESKFVVVDTQSQLEKIMTIQDRVPSLKYIIVKSVEDEEMLGGKVITWEQFMQRGNRYREQTGWAAYQKIAHQGQYEDIVAIVYTSGTTGNPKGACLSNRYIIASCESLDAIFSKTQASYPPQVWEQFCETPLTTLSFLPFCHVGERISGMYSRIYTGFAAYLIDDLTRLYQDMLTVNPHIFGGLPRFYEKIYAKILNEVETGKGYDKQQFYRAIEVSKQSKQHREQNQPIPQALSEEATQFQSSVYDKVRGNFGSRILSCSSGAAPIPKEVLDMFEHAGKLPILEAYGLTEFVCCAFNTPDAHKANSVGKPMPGCQVKIAEDGEILLQGPQMFSGYYKDEQETRQMIDSDGWLHTGDIGKLDEEGFLFITGRKKEFIKTSTGKKIAPLYIENLVKRNHLISNVMVYGDNKKYLTALITLNAMELTAYAQVNNIAFGHYLELTQSQEVRDIVAKVIAEVNAKVSRTEQIKKYTILERDFLIEQNEITPTGKVKRKIVSEKYREIIEKMYGD